MPLDNHTAQQHNKTPPLAKTRCTAQPIRTTTTICELSKPPVLKLPQIVSHPPLLISASSFLEMKLGTPWLSHRFLSIES